MQARLIGRRDDFREPHGAAVFVFLHGVHGIKEAHSRQYKHGQEDHGFFFHRSFFSFFGAVVVTSPLCEAFKRQHLLHAVFAGGIDIHLHIRRASEMAS